MGGFNWVRARAECSVKRTFQTLYEVIDSDVKTANELKVAGSAATFHVESQHKKIIVIREEDIAVRNVVLECLPGSINVREGQEKHLFSGMPRLDEEGHCMLEVDGRLLQLWQFSERALSGLFFG